MQNRIHSLEDRIFIYKSFGLAGGFLLLTIQTVLFIDVLSAVYMIFRHALGVMF